MDLIPILHLSPAKEMKCSYLYYVQLLMIGLAGRWTRTPSSTSLQPKKWNAHCLIMFNFWWSAGLVNGLKPHLPSLSSQKNEMLIFVLYSTSDVGHTGQWIQTPSTTPLQPKKWNASFMDYTQLLMIGRAEWWTQTPSTTPLQPIKWNARFWITFNFWWSAGLVNGLKHHPPPLSSQKNDMLIFVLCSLGWTARLVNGLKPHPSPLLSQWNEILIFGLRSTSDDQLGWSMDSNPIHHPSPAKTVKCSFLYYIQHLMLATLVNGLEPHPPPLSSQKMKCSFLGYVQLLMISQAVRWTQTPSVTPLQLIKWNAHFCITFNFWWSAGLIGGLKPHSPPLSSQKNEMLIFWLCSTSDDQLGWSMDLNPICHPSPAKKMKCSFLYYIQFLMLATLVNGFKPHPPPLCSQKNEMLLLWITLNFWWLAGLSDGLEPHPPPLSSQKKWNARFWITFISDDLPGWLMNLNLICHPSPTKKMKCSIFDYVQLLMISQAGQLTQSPSASPLQPIKWNAHFWITFNFWWSAGLVNGLKPHPPPLSSQNSEMLIFVLHSTSDVGQTGQWTWTSSTTPLQPKNEMLIFGLCSTSDD